MHTLTLVLTVINTIIILYYILRKYLSYGINRSLYKNTLLGIHFYYKRNRNYATSFLYIPFRDSNKVKLQEQIEQLLTYDEQHRRQQLNAMFSWIKTKDGAKQFYKDYHKADVVYVYNLVNEFLLKY